MCLKLLQVLKPGKLTSQQILKHLVLLIVFCVLAWGIHSAARIGIADGFAYLAKEEILSWDASKKRMDPASWFFAQQHYLNARRLVPDQPDYLYNLGRLHYLNALFFTSGPAAMEALEEAENYLVQSILERPVWPLAWAHLALVKAEKNEFDEKYLLALERSTTLGPWEPGVHIAVTDAGFRGWRELDRDYRKLVVDNSVRGVKSQSPGQSGRMIRLLQNLQSEAFVCPYLPRQDYYQQLCVRKMR